MSSPIEELKEARSRLFAGFASGEGGETFHERYTELVDQYFRSNLEQSATGRKLFRGKTPLAFVALGGYGRRELSLYSDIDVMILFPSRIPPLAKGLVEESFYPVWDAGLELGHGIRSVKDCIHLARDDYEVLSSLLDARFICGDSGLYFSLMDTLQKKVLSKKALPFSRWLEEQEQIRRVSYGDASYLLEPHLKEGIGGLRDYHYILWLSKAFFGLAAPRETQRLAVDGRPVSKERKEYWLLNKPAGVLTAVTDPRGRPTVVELVPTHVRVFPVGRLDLDSTGVLLLTNDGELTARLLHPRYHVDKEYIVTVLGQVMGTTLGRLRRGVVLDDGPTSPADVQLIRSGRTKEGRMFSVLRITIHEGRKRQVRRMLEAVGHRVIGLHRSRFDGLTDEGLAPGQARPLSPAELEELHRGALDR
jgi:pseudouridine synthase